MKDMKASPESERKHKKQLQPVQQMDALNILSRGIAHEFNNVIGIIMGYAELAIDDTPASNATREYLEQIYAASFRAKDLVHQISVFAGDSGEEKAPYGLSQLLKNSLKLLQVNFQTGVEIRQKFSCRNDMVLCDPAQMDRMFVNLCTAANGALKDSGAVLEICLENVRLNKIKAAQYATLPPGLYLKLTVQNIQGATSNKGSERIFNPFTSTEGPPRIKGIELSVVYGIVKSHQGQIIFKNVSGGSPKIEVLLPVIRPQSVLRPATKEISPSGAKHILFVEDEKSLVKMAQKMIERFGYAVTALTDPLDALELFKSGPDQFNLVITDMIMPKMSGDQLARKILGIKPDIPIILCTGYSHKLNCEKAAVPGIKAIIFKPFVAKDLNETIRKILDSTPQPKPAPSI